MLEENGTHRLTAQEFLKLDKSILRCVVFDEEGAVTSFAESSFVAESPLAAVRTDDESLMSGVVLDDLPQVLGKVRFKILATDLIRLAIIRIGDQLVMFAVPGSVSAEPICHEASKRYQSRLSEISARAFEPHCENCGKLVTLDADPKAEAFLIDIQETIGGARRTIQYNTPVRICGECQRRFGRPKYLFHGKLEFDARYLAGTR